MWRSVFCSVWHVMTLGSKVLFSYTTGKAIYRRMMKKYIVHTKKPNMHTTFLLIWRWRLTVWWRLPMRWLTEFQLVRFWCDIKIVNQITFYHDVSRFITNIISSDARKSKYVKSNVCFCANVGWLAHYRGLCGSVLIQGIANPNMYVRWLITNFTSTMIIIN